MDTTSELSRLRQRAHADRHATSFPLIVIGAVGYHYAVTRFGGPVLPVFGLPLAFVIVWLLQWRNERANGVGPGSDDVLVIGFGVYLGSLFTSSELFFALLHNLSGGIKFAETILFLPIAVGLFTLGIRQRNRMISWSAGVLIVGTVVAAFAADGRVRVGQSSLRIGDLIVQVVFAAVTIVGNVACRNEVARLQQ